MTMRKHSFPVAFVIGISYLTTGLEIKGGFSFTIGSYGKDTLDKTLMIDSLRRRFEEHPCHGCLCFDAPASDNESDWSRQLKKSLGMFNYPITQLSEYAFNSTESGCYFSPREEYIGNVSACTAIHHPNLEGKVFYRCCDDLCSKNGCKTNRLVRNPEVLNSNAKISRSDQQPITADDLCQITVSDINTCKCLLESRGFKPDSDCLLTDFTTTVYEKRNSSFSGIDCIVDQVYHCRNIN
ncbi:uncharacterized protein LOC142344193 [Convolutriloba macropyga]|uniref:uncharacterized protein LOC142344193 n=1 Tax=Convolutriloba macropyga TaxID=536237 RepID=UPI003F51E451